MLKIYGMLWAMIGVIALLLLITENFTQMSLIAFGFVVFGMIFMGMISVLPSTAVHHVPAPVEPKLKPEKIKADKRVFHAKHLATR
jgi:hypothetical protein